MDACPNDANNDADGDGICGDVDACPNDANNDADADGICGDADACPLDPNNDADNDGVCGNVDVCPGHDDAVDADGDGTPDGCDVLPNDASETKDSDNDGIGDNSDNFPNAANPSVADASCEELQQALSDKMNAATCADNSGLYPSGFAAGKECGMNQCADALKATYEGLGGCER